MTPREPDSEHRVRRFPAVPGLRRQIWLTLAGMLAERSVRCFWPAWCALLATYLVWKAAPLSQIELAAFAWFAPALVAAMLALWGAARLRLPRRADAIRRIDAELPERPLAALADRQATGLDDEISRSLWEEHLARMAVTAKTAKSAEPDFRLSASDRWSLRYIAATAFVVAFLFLPEATDTEPAAFNALMRTEPGIDLQLSAFDAWVEPPAYTGEPGVYLNETAMDSSLQVPVGSRLSVRLYGEPDSFLLGSTYSAKFDGHVAGQEWRMDRDGHLELTTPDGEFFRWEFTAVPDSPPVINILGEVEAGPFGQTSMRFGMEDDHGIAGASLVVDLELAQVERMHGLAPEPEKTESDNFRIPLPFGSRRQELETTFTADFGDHSWAGLPVEFVATVTDAIGQSTSLRIPTPAMPGRIMVDPVAKALVEQRRDLHWNRNNGERVAKIIRAISTDPADIFGNVSAYLTTQMSIRVLETALSDGIDDDERDGVAELLWRTALELEEGDLAVSRENLAEIAKRLAEAIERGAPDAEINRLKEEYRQALGRFLSELARKSQQLAEGANGSGLDGADFAETREISMSDIERLMDELERLLAEGRIDEAGRTLDELRRLTENMVAARPGDTEANGNFRQSMQGFGGTLQRQQGLADEAFRILQERQGPEGAGASEGNVGSSGGLGRGQSHFGQGSGSDGSGGEGDIAERQEILRQELRQQMRQLADRGLAGRDAVDAFEKAARAMTRARDRLRQNEVEDALAAQSEAIEALGKGVRTLGQEIAGPGNGYGGPPGSGATDPLGRRRSGDAAGTGNLVVPDELLRRRSQELREEIRRRAGDSERPDFELDYLIRLLELY